MRALVAAALFGTVLVACAQPRPAAPDRTPVEEPTTPVEPARDGRAGSPAAPDAAVDAGVVETRVEDAAQDVLTDAAVDRAAPDAAVDRAPPDLVPAPDVATDAKPMKTLAVPTGPMCFGADCDGNNPFPGQMDRIRLHDRPLAAEEIAAHAGRRYEPCASTPSCVGEWAFDQPPVDGAFASTGTKPLPAKIVGDVAIVDGPDGKAIQLAGKGRLEVARDPALHFPSTFTFEAWVRRSACPAGFPGPVPCRFMRMINSTGSFAIEHHAGGETMRTPGQGGYIGDPWSPTDVWTHVAFVFDAPRRTFMFYVGGKQATKLQRW